MKVNVSVKVYTFSHQIYVNSSELYHEKLRVSKSLHLTCQIPWEIFGKDENLFQGYWLRWITSLESTEMSFLRNVFKICTSNTGYWLGFQNFGCRFSDILQKKLTIKWFLYENCENLGNKSHPFSKSVGAKSVLPNIFCCSCIHCTRLNIGLAIVM